MTTYQPTCLYNYPITHLPTSYLPTHPYAYLHTYLPDYPPIYLTLCYIIACNGNICIWTVNASSYHIQSYRFRETRFSKPMYTVYTIFILINN